MTICCFVMSRRMRWNPLPLSSPWNWWGGGEIPAGGEGPSCWKSWISDPRLPLPPRPLQSSQKKIAIAGTLKNTTTTKLIAKNLFLSKYGMGQTLSDKVALGEIQMKLPRISGLPTHSVPQWKHPGEILTRGSLD